MSRPHDGHKAFFPFGNPFRAIFPKGSYLSPKLLALLYSFENILSERLKNLKPSEKSSVLSLSWMRQALQCLCDTHTDIKTLITDLQFPVSDWDEKWMDMYLDNSIKLLDICIAFSSEVARFDQHQLLMKYVLHVLDSTNGKSPQSAQKRKAHASLNDWILQINSRSDRLEDCSIILQHLVGTLGTAKVKNSAKGKVLIRAFYAVKIVTIYVCSAIAAAFSGSSKFLIELCVPESFLWAEAFKCLQADVFGELQREISLAPGKLTLVKELQEVERIAQKLHVLTSVEKDDCALSGKDDSNCREERSQQGNVREERACEEPMVLENGSDEEERERWRESVAHLVRSSERLAHELELLSKQVNNFFEIVLTGRDALLCNLRAPDAAKVQDR